MANNREISQFAGLVTVNDTTNQVSIASSLNISGGGRLGIGTDNPATKLEVATSVDGEATLATFKNTSTGGTNETVDINLGLEGPTTTSNVVLRAGKEANHNSGAATDNFFAIHTTLDNVSSEKLRVDSTGRVLVGDTTSFDDDSSFQIRGSYVNSGQRNGMSIQYGEASSSGSADINLIRDRNNSGGVTSLQDNDAVGKVKFFGLDGTSPVESARIECVVGGPTGISSMPGELRFYTTPTGSGTPVERMKFTPGGATRYARNVAFYDGVYFVADNTWRTIATWYNSGNRGGAGNFLILLSQHAAATNSKDGVYHCIAYFNGTVGPLTKISGASQLSFDIRQSGSDLQVKSFDSGTGLNTACRISFIFNDGRVHLYQI